MQERVRNGFLENEIEIPVPKMGLIDRPIPLEDDEVDQYAHKKELKKEDKVRQMKILQTVLGQVVKVQDMQLQA